MATVYGSQSSLSHRIRQASTDSATATTSSIATAAVSNQVSIPTRCAVRSVLSPPGSTILSVLEVPQQRQRYSEIGTDSRNDPMTYALQRDE